MSKSDVFHFDNTDVFNFNDNDVTSSYRQRAQRKVKTADVVISDNISTTMLKRTGSGTADNKFQQTLSEKITSIIIIDKKYKEIKQCISSAQCQAAAAERAARKASKQPIGFFQKTRAIEALQSAQKQQAMAGIANTRAIQELAEIQSELITAIKALFQLGTYSIAENHFVYRMLEIKLKEASTEQLSDLAKQEIFTVMKQLNDQKNILIKQNELTDIVQHQDNTIKQQGEEILNLKASVEKLIQQQQCNTLVSNDDNTSSYSSVKTDLNDIKISIFDSNSNEAYNYKEILPKPAFDDVKVCENSSEKNNSKFSRLCKWLRKR